MSINNELHTGSSGSCSNLPGHFMCLGNTCTSRQQLSLRFISCVYTGIPIACGLEA